MNNEPAINNKISLIAVLCGILIAAIGIFFVLIDISNVDASAAMGYTFVIAGITACVSAVLIYRHRTTQNQINQM